ncbi:MAG: phosphoribosylamine--glycine ligase [Bifidobacteriaceae bacterium]|nr:phosphoribosylamine--glycine ligase [Bifidobacteriaceae bacterium]
MRILVIGSGAREHAIVRALALTPSGEPTGNVLFAAPGNPGIGDFAERSRLDILDPNAVAARAVELGVDLVVIGPEAPLVIGVADAVRDAGIPCFGPSINAAKLEGSKSFAKQIMSAANVPTAGSVTVDDVAALPAALDQFGPPYVVKNDGLAAGKGVVVTDDKGVALAHGESVIGGGGKVVVEEFLDGPEVSLFCITDGTTVVPLAPAQDFKRLGEGDTGPNTGGMGAYSPLPWSPPGLVDDVLEHVARPVIAEMARRGTPFQGVLYCGLALTSRGVRVVEFNVRFGDPETQVVLARLRSPLAELLLAAARGELADFPPLEWSDDAAVVVVIAAENYPARPVTGTAIEGVRRASEVPGGYVLQAGTDLDKGGRLVSAGGRVLSVVGLGPSLEAAQSTAYLGVARVRLAGSHFRSDIAAAVTRDLRKHNPGSPGAAG